MNDDLGAALRVIAANLGVKPQDLGVLAAEPTKPVPTFGEYILVLRRSLPDSTVRNYDSYWRVVETAWSGRHLNEPTATQIEELVQQHRRHAVVRRNSRGGSGAAANMVAAIRCIYRHAERDGIRIPNPARLVNKPHLPSLRHALTLEQVLQIASVAATTGNDTELDALIIRLHIETACRRSGSLGLRLADLVIDQCLVKLREKGGTIRWQPVSPMLMSRLVDHAHSRGAREPDDRVLRYRDGRAISRRRYQTLTERIRKQLPWADRLQVSAHWVRHTTLTFVEREFGPAVARAFGGHSDTAGHLGATAGYTKASIVEVAEALVALTGQDHPLARAVRHPLAPRTSP